MVSRSEATAWRILVRVRILVITWVLWAFISPALILALSEDVRNNFYLVMTWVAAAASLFHLVTAIRLRAWSVPEPLLADSLYMAAWIMLATSLYYLTFAGPVFSLVAIVVTWRARRAALRRLNELYGPV